MNLPRLLVLTDRSQCGGSLRDAVAAAVDAGARAIVLREKDLVGEERAALAADLRAVLDPVGGLLLHGGAARSEGWDGVHLSAGDPFPSPRPSLVGRSCHGADELARARSEGCDYVFLSPVFATPSKPGYGPALGFDGFARLVTGGPPAYALGGVLPADVAGCLAAGAFGVAVMGPVMRDPGIVSAYLAVLEPAPVTDGTGGPDGAGRRGAGSPGPGRESPARGNTVEP